ncbi:hypothetical protein AB0M39_27580 [Streptomyces sp. NPDC051907]|uniref:hypothetical protein n=1 Tax=Streptomyces sp. NPDC051907 TaxID=3155284 RepID=UPI0034202479
MTDLLDESVEAHGGLARRNELESVSAHLPQGGAVWGLKGQQGVLDDIRITACCTRSECRTTRSVPPAGAVQPVHPNRTAPTHQKGQPP